MMTELPEGQYIGKMQASLDWVLAHTARFYGIVRLTIGEGEGFILINFGRPVAASFRQGQRLLKGSGALDFFKAQQLIDFTFIKYNDDEFGEAQRFCTESAIIPRPRESPREAPREASRDISREQPREPRAPASSDEIRKVSSPEVKILPAEAAETGPAMDEPAEQPVIATGFEEEGIPIPGRTRDGVTDLEQAGHVLLGQVLRLPYVQAVSIFSRGTNVLSFGNVKIESLVVLAEDMLQTAKEISRATDAGSFVHLTLQIPEGNVIIAPYYGEYLCILTDPGINLGQIRKILRAIHAGQLSEEGEI